ncbi:hypothetical protein [Streptomyces hebeiensis]
MCVRQAPAPPSRVRRRTPTLRPAVDIADLEFDHTGTAYGVKSLPVSW